MDLGITMSAEVLESKLEDANDPRHRVATWNTKRLPKRLTAGWTNRLFVASGGVWRGYFLLSGDVLWNPDDPSAPYAMIFDPRSWTWLKLPMRVPRFRGWRYLDPPLDTDAGSLQPSTTDEPPPA